MNPISNNLVLELHIPDFAKAREFYALFGFEQLSYTPKTGSRGLEYMILKREDPLGRTLINFYGNRPEVSQHAHFKDYPVNTPKGYAVELTVPVTGVDKVWDSVKDKLAEEQIAQGLELKLWGQKDFRVVDPFGFYLRFTGPVDWGQ